MMRNDRREGPSRKPATHPGTGFTGQPGRLRINHEKIALRVTFQYIRDNGDKINLFPMNLPKRLAKKLIQIIGLDFPHIEEIICIIFYRDFFIENVFSHPARSSEFLFFMGAILQKDGGKGKF